MKMRLRQLVVSSLALAAVGAWSVAYGQVQNLDGQAPKVEVVNAPFITWALAAAFVVGILAIAFRNAKRSHLD